MDQNDGLLRRIGQSLRAARLRANLTQGEAAEHGGISREYWSHIESDGRNLSLETIVALANAVGSDLREIVIEATSGKKLGPEKKTSRKIRERAKKKAFRS